MKLIFKNSSRQLWVMSSQKPKEGVCWTFQVAHYQTAHNQFYENKFIELYASRPTKRLTLNFLTDYGKSMNQYKLLKSANYVRTELPVRLAHRIRDFQKLPFIVVTNPHIQIVYDLYLAAFNSFRNIPPIETLQENDLFCTQLRQQLNTHLPVIPRLWSGMIDCAGHLSNEQLDTFITDMLRTRISRRVIAEQHIHLTQQYNLHNTRSNQKSQSFSGIVDSNCHVKRITQHCIELASKYAMTQWGAKSHVILDGHFNTTFTYIPDHIEYILYELLINSMGATIYKHQNESKLPLVQVTVANGPQSVMFRISDQGGGIQKQLFKHLWSVSQLIDIMRKASINDVDTFSKHKPVLTPFQHWEFEKELPKIEAKITDHIRPQNLYLGLQMAKVYAEYWGGSLDIVNILGYGTDSYVRIVKGENDYVTSTKCMKDTGKEHLTTRDDTL